MKTTFLAAALLGCSLARAVPIAVDFEAFTSGQTLTTEVPGLTFSNTVILTAGVTLNEVDFPPRSGVNVAHGLGAGPITIDFAAPLDSFAAYFTYNSAVTMTAYDSALAVLGSVTSAFSANYVSGGDAGASPNELMQLAGLGQISRLTIGDSAINFVMDDLLAVPAVVNVPEPRTVGLILVGLVMMWRMTLRPRHAPAQR